MEGVRLAGHLERDGLDKRGVELEGLGDLNLGDVDGTLGDERDATLGLVRLVLGEVELEVGEKKHLHDEVQKRNKKSVPARASLPPSHSSGCCRHPCRRGRASWCPRRSRA